MVTGLERFREAFKGYSDKYIIIGGTACDILISDEGFIPRATKDIDIILVIEELTREFVERFWEFIMAGKYKSMLKEQSERKYYRFTDPIEQDFPRQLELFSRVSDSLDNGQTTRFTHIAIDSATASLSAILMDDTYYEYTIDHSSIVDGLHRANPEALICLKASAFLDLTNRVAHSEKVDDKDLKKHKHDVFRLVALLRGDSRFELPMQIKADMIAFADKMKDSLPDKAILREMGVTNLRMGELYLQLRRVFDLEL